jgi:flagellin-like protein
MDSRRCKLNDGRAVSQVIGVILLIAIVVILAAIVASLALGFDEKLQEPTPTGTFDYEYISSGDGNTNDRPYVNISHDGGDVIDGEQIVIRDESGNSITWKDVWTGGPEVKPGEFVHIDGFGSDSVLDPICEEGDTYKLIFEREDGGNSIVTEWSARKSPDLPESSSYNSGDGTPTWC